MFCSVQNGLLGQQSIGMLRCIRRSASTVYALSSGQGKCGVAVVRVTGNRARDVFTSMTIPSTLPKPRIAELRRIVHPVTQEGLDKGLVLWFPSPRSFTGEDCCELHIHGGLAVIAAVLSALSKLEAYEPAQPGDFTRRAFYNGKLDLTRVEGLGDLIHAETEAQRRQAFRQMDGALAHLYTSWRQTLLQCRAALEAYIDFSEEENIEEGVVQDVNVNVQNIIIEIKSHLSDDRRGERLRSGLQLAIIGRPNVGKSSFLNTITQRPAAIVSPIPGTTRDVVETSLDIGGYPVIVSDTAGLRETADIIESEGVQRAISKAKQADIAVVILEASEILPFVKMENFQWDSFYHAYFADIGICRMKLSGDEEESLTWMCKNNFVTLINKIDLIENKEDKDLLLKCTNRSCVLVSMKTKEGFDASMNILTNICAAMCEVGTAENPTLTATRHRTHITACLQELQRIIMGHEYTSQIEPGLVVDIVDAPSALNQLESYKSNTREVINSEKSQDGKEVEIGNLLHSEETILLAAYHLERATKQLGYVTGQVTTEDVLEHIFSAFCIGK